MIEVKSLSKRYGRHLAVDGISFKAKAGEVLGFLGPNGAGKSTTMKVITGFLLPSGGEVRVSGLDVVKDTLKVQRVIGYLPENASSYGEMTVGEFLAFVGELHGLRESALQQRIDELMELVGLAGTKDRIIDTLSKGYRQRVCFAQAIIHDPDVLILDEPTDGLDPNQKHHVRDVIRRMGRKKTIVLSTHILEEMEAVCDRAVVINNGKIVFNGTPQEMAALSKYHQSLVVVTATNDEKTRQLLESAKGVKTVESEQKGDCWQHSLLPERPIVANYALNVEGWLRKQGVKILEIYTGRGRVDEVFRTMTLGEQAAGLPYKTSSSKTSSSKTVTTKTATTKTAPTGTAPTGTVASKRASKVVKSVNAKTKV